MKTPKLNQVLAIEKGVKSRSQSAITKLYHAVQKPGLLIGLMKTYSPLEEGGQGYPAERQKVQVRAEDVINDTHKALGELFDVTAQKDWANCGAKADVVIGSEKVLEDVPVTYLLFLEKQLTDFRTLIQKIPTLDPSEEWKKDEGLGLYRTDPIKTNRTAKVQKPIVLYDATEEHPAQTQLITEDIVVGEWTTVKQSGALPVDRKLGILKKVDRFLEAVKFARETANSEEAPKVGVADKVFDYLLD